VEPSVNQLLVLLERGWLTVLEEYPRERDGSVLETVNWSSLEHIAFHTLSRREWYRLYLYRLGWAQILSHLGLLGQTLVARNTTHLATFVDP